MWEIGAFSTLSHADNMEGSVFNCIRLKLSRSRRENDPLHSSESRLG
jgi:hypothetical protein